MAISANISIERGRTGVIEVEIDDLPIVEGLKTKFFANTKIGDPTLFTLTGTISGSTISFSYTYDITKTLSMRRLYYEVVVYTESRDYVKTVTYGLLNVSGVVKVDPII